MYGRADVERWIKSGKLKPSRISPGKKRYKLIDLQKLANIHKTISCKRINNEKAQMWLYAIFGLFRCC